MGWWSYPEEPSVALGDEVMDETYGYLEKLRDLYEGHLKRHPSTSELQAVLRLALRVNGEKYVDDLTEDTQVESVTIKMVKRPKRQKYKLGDVFAIPLEREKYMFGRIVNLADGWDLVEVFAHTAESPTYSSAITKTKRLLPPMWINPKELFADWKWKIIHSDPEYDPSELSSLRYVMGTPGNYRWLNVNDFQPRGRLSDQEAEILPQWAMMPAEAAVDQIQEAAREQGLR